jgi:hypothetical protein
MHLHEIANPVCDRKSVRKAAMQFGRPCPAEFRLRPSGRTQDGMLYLFCSF